MLPDSDADYRKTRAETFDEILKVIEARKSAVPVVFSASIHLLAPEAAQNGALREAWGLLGAGVSFLKDGGPQGQGGSLPGALEKTSLRVSALAASLGVRRPAFEETFYMGLHDSGRDEAIFLTRRLIEAANADIDPSRKAIAAQLLRANPAAAFGMETPGSDPALKAIFDAAHLPVPPDAGAPAADVAALRRQTVLSFNALVSAFGEAASALKSQLELLPPPPAVKPGARKGQSFDF